MATEVPARGRRSRWGPALLCLLVVGSWAFRFIGRSRAPPLDLILYFYPTYVETYGRIAAGVLPLWNPYQLCGMPWLATLQGGFFYPLHALYLVLPPNVALAISHVAHLLLAALGTFAFVRRAGLPALAACLAAALFTLRGLIAASLNAPNYLEAASWLPLGALAVLELVRGRRLAGGMALLATATACSALAGYPQPMVYVVYTWATLVVALLIAEGGGAGRWLRTGLAFGGALALGFLAAAIQLAPALELTRLGMHRDLAIETMQPLGSFHVLTLVGVLAGDPFAWGVAALALATVAVTSTRHRALAWWAAGWAVLSGLFSLGTDTPLFALYRRLPLLGWFRFPDRIIGVTDFGVAVAAAAGLAALLDERDGPPRRVPALLALVAVAGLIVAGLAVGLGARTLPVAGFALGTGILLVARLLGARAPIGPMLVVLVLAELSFGPWSNRVSYSTDVFDRYRHYERSFHAIASAAGGDRVWLHGPVAALSPDFALKLATRYRLRAINDYEPLNSARQAEYFSYFANAEPYSQRWKGLYPGSVDTFDPPPGVAPYATRRRLIDQVGMRFLVVPAEWVPLSAALREFVHDAGYVQRPIGGPELTVFENPDVLPRAFVVYRTRPAPPVEELLATISRSDFDPMTLSYVEGATDVADGTGHGAPARIVVDEERTVEVEATLAEPGLVVLADPFYPGWRATVDGALAPIVAVNHLFRGVRAAAGTHHVRFEYRPVSVALGAAGSVVGWAAIALLAVRARRRDLS